MKLAEALQERADLQHKIYQLTSRLDNNAQVQEGEQPAEDPASLLKELDSSLERLEYLIIAINKTNEASKDEGETLSALIARRYCMQKKIEMLQNFLHAASSLTKRTSKTEIVIKSTISVPELRKYVDDLSKKLRILDNRIQKNNWTIDLL